MQTYKIDPTCFYEGQSHPVLAENRAAVEVPIKQLIERFDLAGKRVLSVGAGWAFEEYWFLQAGCQITLLDNSTEIQAHVASCPTAQNGIEYVIGDAGQYDASGLFDVLYLSSFEPDELRREQMQAEFCQTRTPDQAYHHVTWPAGADAFHPMVARLLRFIKRGGLFISQHYRGGVYVEQNPHYLEDVRRQLAQLGIALTEAYCFRRSTAHLLLIGRRTPAFLARLTRQRRRRPITTFHGRYPDQEIKSEIVRLV